MEHQFPIINTRGGVSGVARWQSAAPICIDGIYRSERIGDSGVGLAISLSWAYLVAESSSIDHPAWLTYGLRIGNKIDLLQHHGDVLSEYRRSPKQLKPMPLVPDNLTAKGRFLHAFQARSSVGERFLDTEEVGSSILPVPTIF